MGGQPGQLRDLFSKSKLERGWEYRLSSPFTSMSEEERGGEGVGKEKREREAEE